jgi:hypothetical protein
MPSCCRRHKCRCCHQLYEPEPRSRYHQRYCSKPDCQEASKAASHRRWRRSDKGRDYFRGSANTHRVDEWRRKRPGHARNRGKPSDMPVDDSPPQTTVPPADTPTLNAQASAAQFRALQDDCLTHRLLLAGLIAHYTGALQDDFDPVIQRLIRLGQQCLGPASGVAHGSFQASALKAAVAASAPAVQLDRPSPGP